jgi:hypothetical protein
MGKGVEEKQPKSDSQGAESSITEKEDTSTKEKQPSQFSQNIKQKVANFRKKAGKSYNDFKKWLINKEIYVEGKEPPKSYFGKKFIPLFAVFIFYSFLIIFNINTSQELFFQILTFGNPFAFAVALMMFYLTISVLFSVDKIREFFFEKNTAIKQAVIFPLIVAGYFFMFLYIDDAFQFNYMSILLILAMMWLILQSSRFYTYSRKFSTKIEGRLVAKYSIWRNFAIFLIPLIIVGFLVIISWYFRTFIVFFALDILGPFNPSGAMDVYQVEMRLIMPLIYTSLIITATFVMLEFFLTRKRGETRRAGLFDNFTFALIVFFIFFYQIYQVTLYTFLRPETTNALQDAFGGQSNVMGYFFIVEFCISMVFLIRILLKIGSTLGWRILFFRKDGLIMFFLGCIFAQTISRFGVAANVPNQEIGGFSQLLMHDRFLISIIMIIFLGLTILIYYIKPHETSLFMRIQKEIVKEEEKSKDVVLKILRNEFIRRGEAFPIEDIIVELMKASNLPKIAIYSLIEKLDEKVVEFRVFKEKNKDGQEIKYADFVTVTGRYQKKGEAEKKAKIYFSEKLYESATTQPKENMMIKKELDEEKASDMLLMSLSQDFTKKKKAEVKHKNLVKSKTVSFAKEYADEAVADVLIKIIKKEYLYRIENSETYPNYKMPISEIAPTIEMETRINPGALYPMLEELSRKNLELNLLNNPEDKEDKIISFTPHWDFEIDYLLKSYKPEDYSEIVINYYKKLNLRLSRVDQLVSLKDIFSDLQDNTESQKSLKGLYKNLIVYYPEYEKELKYEPDNKKLIKLIDKYADTVEKMRKEKKAQLPQASAS